MPKRYNLYYLEDLSSGNIIELKKRIEELEKAYSKNSSEKKFELAKLYHDYLAYLFFGANEFNVDCVLDGLSKLNLASIFLPMYNRETINQEDINAFKENLNIIYKKFLNKLETFSEDDLNKLCLQAKGSLWAFLTDIKNNPKLIEFKPLINKLESKLQEENIRKRRLTLANSSGLQKPKKVTTSLPIEFFSPGLSPQQITTRNEVLSELYQICCKHLDELNKNSYSDDSIILLLYELNQFKNDLLTKIANTPGCIKDSELEDLSKIIENIAKNKRSENVRTELTGLRAYCSKQYICDAIVLLPCNKLM